MTRDDATGVWSVTGDAAWKGKYYLYDVEVYAPSTGRSSTTSSPTRTRSPWRRTRPAARSSTSPTPRSRPPAGSASPSPAPARPRTSRSTSSTSATSRSTTRPCRPRSAARTRPSRRPTADGMRHLRDARGRWPDPRPPAAGLRHRHHRRGPLDAPEPPCDLASLPARLGGAAGLHRAGPRPGRLQLGLRPVPLHGARGLLRHRSARARRAPSSSARWSRRSTRPACGSSWTSSTTTQRGRPGREVGARPDRARLLPPPARGRRGRDLHVLREHRDRARDDGEAHGRLGRHLGPRVQGRRLPLRPDGPPLEGQHARRPGGARRADPRRGRRRRQEDLPLRRGLELRRGRERRPLRAGHPARTWPAPASARSTTGSATPCAAAARSTATSACNQGFGSGLFTDPNGVEHGTPAQQRARLLLSRTRSRSA